MIVSLPGVHLFCTVWAIMPSLWENVAQHRLRFERSSLNAWRYNMINSRNSVYVNGRIDYLLGINVQSEIIGKK